MSVRIAGYNQKGGTGKTTVTVKLAAGLAELGKATLIVDLDGQASSLTTARGIYAKRGAPDEAADLDALKAERSAWVAPSLRYRKAIMIASRAAGHSVFSNWPAKRHRKAPPGRCQEEYRQVAAYLSHRTGEERT